MKVCAWSLGSPSLAAQAAPASSCTQWGWGGTEGATQVTRNPVQLEFQLQVERTHLRQIWVEDRAR